jgi:copper transport protein
VRRRIVFVAAAAAVGLALASPTADAHALLRTSDPAEGAQLQASPATVTCTFTETPEPNLTVIRVLDSTGNELQNGAAKRVPGNPLSLRVAVKPLDKGVYTVTWRVVSKVDGHVTAGAFAFGVGVAPGPGNTPSTVVVPKNPPPNPTEITGRWLLFAGLIGLLGGAWMSAAVFGGTPPAVRRYAGGAWLVGLAGLALLAAAQWRASGAGLDSFAGTTIGRAILYRGVGLAVAGGALLAARRLAGRARRGAFWLAGIAAAGAIYAHVDAGHAAARGTIRLGKVLAQWGHFVGAGVWIGGLAALLLGVRGVPSEDKTRAVRRFSVVAAFALALVAGTGILRAVEEIDTWHGLFSSGYGRLVLVKGGLLLVLAVLGAINRYRNVPAVSQNLGSLRRVSRAEISIAAVTLVAAAVLASISPPYDLGKAAASPVTGVVLTGNDFATSVRVRLEIAPGDAGLNRFVLKLFDYDSGDAINAGHVVLRFTYLDNPAVGSSQQELKRTAAGTYSVASASNLSLQGRWQIIVLVQQNRSSVEVPLEFATPCRTEAIPGAPGAPTLYNTKLPGGRTVQMYVDPGKAGTNEVHATYFDTTGNELPVAGPVTIRSLRVGSSSVTFEVRRFSTGHFVADATLQAGARRFDVAATTATGEVLRSCFEETIAA